MIEQNQIRRGGASVSKGLRPQTMKNPQTQPVWETLRRTNHGYRKKEVRDNAGARWRPWLRRTPLQNLCWQGAFTGSTQDRTSLLHGMHWLSRAGCASAEETARLKTNNKRRQRVCVLVLETGREDSAWAKETARLQTNTKRRQSNKRRQSVKVCVCVCR